MRKENADVGPSEADGLEDKGTYAVLTRTVPLSEDQLFPQTRSPRTSCPPGHLVLGLDVPRQDTLSPRTILQQSFKVEVLLDHGDYNYVTFSCHYPTSSSKNQCYIIQHKCIEHFHSEDGVLSYSAYEEGSVNQPVYILSVYVDEV